MVEDQVVIMIHRCKVVLPVVALVKVTYDSGLTR